MQVALRIKLLVNNQKSKQTRQLEVYLTERKIDFCQEYAFHKHYCHENRLLDKPRQFKFDFALVDEKIALEIEGGIWTRGRHIRPQGFINDCIKYNLASMCGWVVYRLPSTFFEGSTKYYLELIKVLDYLA